MRAHWIAATKAFGGQFVRVNQWANAYIANEGFVEGASGTAMRYRSAICADEIHVFADVHVKHGSHAIVADRPIREQARDVEFFDASVLTATACTGDPTKVEEVLAIKEGSDLPVLVGSGINADSLHGTAWKSRRCDPGVSVERTSLDGRATNPDCSNDSWIECANSDISSETGYRKNINRRTNK